MIDAIKKIVEPIQRRVMLMVGRCILTAVKDGNRVQLCQASMLDDEVRDDMQRMAEYGFTSVPLSGAQGAVVFVGGDRGHGIVIATDDYRYRLKELAPGEVALYTDEGDKIVLKRGHIIEIDTHTLIVNATTKVTLNTPLVELTGNQTVAGDVHVDGDIEAEGDITDNVDTGGKSMGEMRDIYNVHTHPDTTSGGNTGVPNEDM